MDEVKHYIKIGKISFLKERQKETNENNIYVMGQMKGVRREWFWFS